MEDKVYFGEVVWFSKGIGFIAWEISGVKQKDMFLHYSDINVQGFKTLTKGQRVSFEIGKNANNIDKAIKITPIT